LASLAGSRHDPARAIRGPEDFAAAFGVPPETIERLILYERLLRQWQKAVNLVAPSTLDAVWHRHFADSAQLVAHAPPGVRSWIDLGSGAGFPGLVAAIVMAAPPKLGEVRATASPPPVWGRDRVGGIAEHRRPGVPPPLTPPHKGEGDPVATGERGMPRFTLVESDTRKCAFLREVVRQTGISQAGIAVDILSRRAESARVSVNESLPRVVSARALAPLGRLFELAAPFCPPDTTLLLLKGKEAEREVRQAKSRWQFQVVLRPSVTESHGRIAVVTNLERKAKD
jgi:16S rRNA (guanine527-N7)-methyltransferase